MALAFHLLFILFFSRDKLSSLASVYEGLRQLRAEATAGVGGGGGVASVPMMSLDGLQHAVSLLSLGANYFTSASPTEHDETIRTDTQHAHPNVHITL